MFLLRKQEEEKWQDYAKHFGVPFSEIKEISLLEKVTKLTEHWLKREPFPVWWELCEILFNCCDSCIDEIRLVMNDIQEQLVNGKFANNIVDCRQVVYFCDNYYN